ncbi:MAG: histidine phosphatase family protein [Sideroxydans sp.]|nr:histidine phosphatase family protein [Sideroxydans sp.]
MSHVITVLRHGEVDGRAHIFRGASEEGLTEKGCAQMQSALTRSLTPTLSQREREFDTVATSPLRRCHEFAAQYAQQHALPLQVLPCFSELDFGAWEGLTPTEAAARNPNEYAAFSASHGAVSPPNGETLAAFRERIAHGWHDWLQHDLGERRLLITHAGVMRGLLMELFDFTPAQAFQIALPEAACLRISHLHGHAPFLLSLN